MIERIVTVTHSSRWTALPATGLLLLLLVACDATGSGNAAPTAVVAVPPTAAGSSDTAPTIAPAVPPTAVAADNVAPPPVVGGKREKQVTVPVDGSLEMAASRYDSDVSTVHFVYDDAQKGETAAVFGSIHAEGDIDRSVVGATKMQFTVTKGDADSDNGDWLVTVAGGKDPVIHRKVGGAWQVVAATLGGGGRVYLNLLSPRAVASPAYGKEASLSTVSSSETLNGQECSHYRHFSGAADSADRTDTDVWVSKTSGLYVRIQTVGKTDTVTWDFSNYDAPVTIEASAP